MHTTEVHEKTFTLNENDHKFSKLFYFVKNAVTI